MQCRKSQQKLTFQGLRSGTRLEQASLPTAYLTQDKRRKKIPVEAVDRLAPHREVLPYGNGEAHRGMTDLPEVET